MTRPKIGKFLGAGLFFLISGCLDSGLEQISYPDPITTTVFSETITVDVDVDQESGEFLLSSGNSYEEFIDSLSRTPPHIIKLTPKHGRIDMSGLQAELWAIAMEHKTQVITTPPNKYLAAETDIRVEIIYFVYEFRPCGATLARRKLDQSGLTTPGFGCAVYKNLLLSIVDPGKLASRKTPDAGLSTFGRLEK
jgi:hypothetical protein